MSLKGKSILVTGAASGMGRASALLLGARGARLALADIQEDAGKAVLEEITKTGGEAFFRRTDLTLRPEVRAVVRETLERYGKLDVVANVAGKSEHKLFLDTDDGTWDRMIKTNLYGSFHVNQEAVREMVSRGGGRIINFASIVGAVGREHNMAYAAAKAGILNLSKSIQKTHAKDNICVFVIAPGATDTPMLRRNRSAQDMKDYCARLPFGKLVTAEQIAELVAFLADDATGHMLAGQVLHTNGAAFMGF